MDAGDEAPAAGSPSTAGEDVIGRAAHLENREFALRAALYHPDAAEAQRLLLDPLPMSRVVSFVRTLQDVHPGGEDEPFALAYTKLGAWLTESAERVKAFMLCLRDANLLALIRPPVGSRPGDWLWLGWEGAQQRAPRGANLSWVDVNIKGVGRKKT